MALSANQAPHFEVTIGGTTCTQTEPQGLEYLQVEDHVDMVGICRVSLGLESTDWSSLSIGDDVSVKVGSSSRKMFVGYITGFRHSWQSGKQTLTVIAMDPLCKIASSRKTMVFEEQKDSDAVSSVLSRAGVDASCDATEETHAYIFQRNESDLNFCKRLAARNGYLLMSQEGQVTFSKAQFDGDPVEIDTTILLNLDYEFSDQQIPPNLTVFGWDYVTKEMVEGSAGSGDVETIGGGSNAVGEAQTWGDDAYISDVHVTSQSGAKAMATSEINRLARNFLRGRASIEGTADVYASTLVKFTDQRTGFNPTGYVVSTRHIVEPNKGYTTEIFFCSNTHPE